MINKEETQHIANLARLGLSEKELVNMEAELSSILDYMEMLNKAETKDVEPAGYSVLIENTMREDLSKPPKETKELVTVFPEKEAGFIKVKTVLKT